VVSEFFILLFVCMFVFFFFATILVKMYKRNMIAAIMGHDGLHCDAMTIDAYYMTVSYLKT